MSAVVAAARRWIGTPYLHQASACGVGTDCLGLVRGIWRELYGQEPEAVPAYTRDWAEPQGDEILDRVASRHLIHCDGTSGEEPGQLLLFRMREGSIAKHLGVLAQSGDAPTFIHAYSGHGVVESSLSRPWRRRISARFRFPDPSSQKD